MKDEGFHLLFTLLDELCVSNTINIQSIIREKDTEGFVVTAGIIYCRHGSAKRKLIYKTETEAQSVSFPLKQLSVSLAI